MEKAHTEPTMKVLGLGMPRTGSTSFRFALMALGYSKTYYWDTMCGNPGHRAVSEELAERKFYTGEPITQADFERVFAGFTGANDWPVSIFAEELIGAYPTAKVVMTVRDNEDKWFKSFFDTVWRYQRWKYAPEGLGERLWNWVLPKLAHHRLYDALFEKGPLGTYLNDGKEWYLSHNEMVRRLVPPEQLLEFNAKEGWGPLCEFLGEKAPDTEYPHVNETGYFQAMVDYNWEGFKMKKMKGYLNGVSMYMLVIAGVLGAVQYLHVQG